MFDIKEAWVQKGKFDNVNGKIDLYDQEGEMFAPFRHDLSLQRMHNRKNYLSINELFYGKGIDIYYGMPDYDLDHILYIYKIIHETAVFPEKPFFREWLNKDGTNIKVSCNFWLDIKNDVDWWATNPIFREIFLHSKYANIHALL
jgi:hypothetical protein